MLSTAQYGRPSFGLIGIPRSIFYTDDDNQSPLGAQSAKDVSFAAIIAVVIFFRPVDALVKLHRDYFVFILDTVAVESHCVGHGIFFIGIYQLPLTVIERSPCY